MRPTRRGWATIAVAVGAVVMAWLFGRRSLNAVVVPLSLALVSAAGQLWIADRPTVERTDVRSGFPGTSRTIDLSIDGTRSLLVDGHDRVSDGLRAEDDTSFAATLPTSHQYAITFTDRGEHAVGPVSVTLSDTLGLFAVECDLGEPDTVLVYPAVRELTSGSRLAGVLGVDRAPVRQEFDDVREYVPGDPLEDINWKASAKRLPDLVLTEYTDRQTSGAVEVVAEGDAESIDDVASAAASVATFLLDAGMQVGVTVPGGQIEAGASERHHTALLELLARTGPGTVVEGPRADVHVRGEGGTVTIETEAGSVPWREVADISSSQFTSVERGWRRDNVKTEVLA
ncbi:MAG: DUF58 domain-containing protein [Halorhabdus sp.]